MKSLFKTILPMLLALVLVSACDDTVIEDDNPPEVEITFPEDGSTTTGLVLVQVTATDDEGIEYVALFIDSDSVAVSMEEPYIFAGDISGYPDGEIVLTAKAVDTSGNITFSAPVSLVYGYDFAPGGNGLIRCSITSYVGDGTLDDTSWGDPYFIFELTAGGQTLDATSQVFLDSRYLTDPFSHDFDIGDGIREISVLVEVWDDDVFDDDAVDYNPSASSYWLYFNRDTYELDWEGSYDGWDDGVPNEPDCQLTVSMEAVVE